MYCRNCGKEIDDKAVVCVGCGVPPLKGRKYCQQCGKEVEAAAEVCVACGTQLAKSAAGGGEEKTLAMIAHLSMIISWFIGPLVIYLIKQNEPGFVKDQAKEALNFAITYGAAWIAVGIVSAVVAAVVPFLALIFPLLYAAIGIGSLVLVVMAGIAANNGKDYRYPFAIRLVK